jgi:hypothetical protein
MAIMDGFLLVDTGASLCSVEVGEVRLAMVPIGSGLVGAVYSDSGPVGSSTRYHLLYYSVCMERLQDMDTQWATQ